MTAVLMIMAACSESSPPAVSSDATSILELVDVDGEGVMAGPDTTDDVEDVDIDEVDGVPSEDANDVTSEDSAEVASSDTITTLVPGVSGRVVDDAGQPRWAHDVAACSATACAVTACDVDGRFHFALPGPVLLAVKTFEILDDVPRIGATVHPASLLAGGSVDVGTLWVPKLGAGTPLPTAPGDVTLDAGDGVSLTLDPAGLHHPTFGNMSRLTAREVPAQYMPSLPGLTPSEIVTAFILSPFSVESEAPIGVHIATTLPEGTPLRLITVDTLDGHLYAPTPARVTSGAIRTAPGVGIHKLSLLVIASDSVEEPD